ncbi:unnamed protein product [Owenia fusiformis]|uniref:Uncharacterized protein n=1 Tax=Owenia fusiformis TaxID=6347 RepID=A0A8J1UQZ0_OWEFU|nr:unnamed protein product [Owenia fusiformis]
METNCVTIATEKMESNAMQNRLRRRYIRNIMVLSVGCMLTTMPIFGLRNLQSTLNAKNNVGIISLCLMYASLAIGYLIVAAISQKMDIKRAIVTSMVILLAYPVANMYPFNYILYPVSCLVGLASALLWVCKTTYISSTAIVYAVATGKHIDNVVCVFNAGFNVGYGILFQCGRIMSNLLSSIVLSFSMQFPLNKSDDYLLLNWVPVAMETDNETIVTNTTFNSFDYSLTCPINVTYLNNITEYTHQYSMRLSFTVEALQVLYLTCSLIGIILTMCCLDKLDMVFNRSKVGLKQQLKAIFSHLGNRWMLLLTTIMFYLGAQEAYLFGTFTKDGISCSMGSHMVGFYMATYIILEIVAMSVSQPLESMFGDAAITTLGIICQISTLTWLLLWHSVADIVMVMFGLVALWGFTNGIWLTKLTGMSSKMFPKDRWATLTLLRLVEGLGLCTGFSFSYAFVPETQLYILGGLLLPASVAFVTVNFYKIPNAERMTLV